MLVGSFRVMRRHEETQEHVLEWLADVHTRAEAAAGAGDRSEVFHGRMTRLIRRVCCGSDRVAVRGATALELFEQGAVPGTAARTDVFAREVYAAFEHLYADDPEPPDDLVHVTCTGYVMPSGAQRIVAAKGWGDRTRVTHAYHMGCYAAVSALRIALGCASRRVDVVHTELCSLHFDPSVHTPEQLVVQSLFADGIVRYSVSEDGADGLRVLATHETLANGSEDEMTWTLGDRGMRITLSRDVPERLAHVVRPFVTELFARGGFDFAKERASCAFAIHPGGPKIIDGVRDALELSEAQVAASRRTFHRFGNMSSATLPHIWADLIDDPTVARGTIIGSVAFGPGLTLAGALFRKA